MDLSVERLSFYSWRKGRRMYEMHPSCMVMLLSFS